MTLNKMLVAMLTSVTLVAGAAQAAELSVVSGDTGNGLAFLEEQLAKFEAETGHTVTVVPMPSSTTDQFGQYRLWLAAGATDIDLYQTDVIWAPQLAGQLVDLKEAAKDLAAQNLARTQSEIEELYRTKALLRQILERGDAFALRDLAIGGEELLALGYRGKAIGGALDALLSGVIAGEAENDRAALLHYLAALNLPKSE